MYLYFKLFTRNLANHFIKNYGFISHGAQQIGLFLSIRNTVGPHIYPFEFPINNLSLFLNWLSIHFMERLINIIPYGQGLMMCNN